ncbi:MAG: patatin-like phospholipase family protein [Pseudomonadota bacterium]|jgi:NTE family protein
MAKTKKPSQTLLASILILLLVGFCGSSGHTEQRKQAPRRPKVGLVLAGGGALGMAHVGVLKVLEANRIPVDVIAGTSMGSIVGAAYASGATISEMEQILSETDWDALFKETIERENVPFRDKYGRSGQFLGDAKVGIKDANLARFTGVVSGQHVLPLLQRLYYRTPGDIDFDNLPIPFRAIAADIETGAAVPLGSGQLATAARASMAVPGFFTPVEIEGKALVDGGIANNLPVDVTLKLGADRLIVVDLLADLKKKEDIGGLLGISGQIISLLLQQNSTLQRKNMRRGDLLLVPDLKGYGATDFQKAKEIFSRGEQVALANLNALKRFSISEAEYAAYKALRETAPKSQVIVTALKIDSDLRAKVPEIEKSFAFQVGAPLDTKQVEEAVANLYDRGGLAKLEYAVEKDEQGKDILALTARKPTWYDQYLRAGFSLQDDFQGNSAYQLALGARFNELNTAGASLDVRLDIGWRPLLELDFYQPLAENSSYFVNPIISLDRYQVPVRVDGETIAEYGRSRAIGGIGAGRRLGKSGEIMTGVRVGSGRIERQIGDPSLQEGSYEIGDYFGQVSFDSRDTPDFATRGTLFNFEVARNTESLGSSDTFTQMVGSFQQPLTYGRNTLALSTDYGVTLDSIPAERVFVLGGMFDLAGYQPGGLAASDFVIGRLTYYRELSSLGGAFAKLNLFGGGSFELASVRSDLPRIDDNTGIVGGLLFVGADTPILPLYLAAGMNNDDEASIYLNIGRIFKSRR